MYERKEDNSFQADWSVEVYPRRQANTPSTLLIPAAIMPLLNEVMCSRCLPNILNLLLHKYRGVNFCKLLPVSDKVKTLYQAPEQDLQRVDFRPQNRSWLELGQLARAYGISRCLLFVYLFMLYKGLMVIEEVGVPTDKEGRYDLLYPEYIQYQDRLYTYPCKYVRRLSTEPEPWDTKRFKLSCFY